MKTIVPYIRSALNATPHIRPRHLLLPLLCVIGIMFSGLLYLSGAGSEKVVIYFYSAETNINNFKSLKMEFDRYLTQFGDYEFQPFSDRNTFEEHVKDKSQGLLLLSSWHYANIYESYALKPILVGIRDGQKFQKRLLVTGSTSTDQETIKSGQIASASSVPHTQTTLAAMFHEKIDETQYKILTVPKDLDALMSVGFGMAKSALITENSFETLKTINPPLFKKLNIVAESEETLLLIIAAPEGFMQEAQELVTILEKMTTDPAGEKNVKMLGLDGWQPLDPSDTSRLEG